MRQIRDATILVDGKLMTLGEMAEFVAEQKKKAETKTEEHGVIATALLGSAAMVAKETKITRRFWRIR